MEIKIDQREYFFNQERQKITNRGVLEMHEQGIPKAHIAKLLNVPVYVIRKIITGKADDAQAYYCFKKYRKIAVKIYWALKNEQGKIDALAAKHGIELWLALELVRIFEKSRNQGIKKKTPYV